jgi:hypothetical protein
MADAHVETSEINQDSLDGAQPTVSDVGSAEEFEKERGEDTPSASNDAEDASSADVPEAIPAEESCEAEGPTGDAVAALPTPEAEGSKDVEKTENAEKTEKTEKSEETEETNGHTNGHVNGNTNGNGAAHENGVDNEADSTGDDGTTGEKRKSIGEVVEVSPKKARLEKVEGDAETVVAADAPVATNGANGQQQETETAA